MKSEPLTRKQRQMLDLFERLSAANGYRPSVAQLAEELDLSKSTVHFHLMALARKGYLRHLEPGRGVQMTDLTPAESARVPLVGTIAAGKPIEAIEDQREKVSIPRSMARGQTYALRVQGSSMVDDGILDGDIVVIRSQPSVDNGEVAVALLEDGRATLKRVYRDGTRIRLEPANATMRPTFVDHVTIQGKLVGLLRLYN